MTKQKTTSRISSNSLRPEAANEFYDGDHDNDKESDVEIWPHTARGFSISCGLWTSRHPLQIYHKLYNRNIRSEWTEKTLRAIIQFLSLVYNVTESKLHLQVA